jgi:hypothetical protein
MGWSLYCSQSQLQYHADELSHGFGFGICRHVVPVLTAASSFASGGLELRAVLQRLQRRHVHPSNRHFQSWRSLIDIRSCNQQRDVRCSVSYRCYLHRSIYYVGLTTGYGTPSTPTRPTVSSTRSPSTVTRTGRRSTLRSSARAASFYKGGSDKESLSVTGTGRSITPSTPTLP